MLLATASFYRRVNKEADLVFRRVAIFEVTYSTNSEVFDTKEETLQTESLFPIAGMGLLTPWWLGGRSVLVGDWPFLS